MATMTDKDSRQAIDRFESAVRAQMDRGSSRISAINTVARKYPDVHRDYIAATNRRK